jgi:hypothetical protein
VSDEQQPTPGVAPAAPPDVPPVPAKHLARDRFGATALRAAHNITAGLAEAGVEDDGVVVVRTDGPHRTFAALESLLDEALDED